MDGKASQKPRSNPGEVNEIAHLRKVLLKTQERLDKLMESTKEENEALPRRIGRPLAQESSEAPEVVHKKEEEECEKRKLGLCEKILLAIFGILFGLYLFSNGLLQMKTIFYYD